MVLGRKMKAVENIVAALILIAITIAMAALLATTPWNIVSKQPLEPRAYIESDISITSYKVIECSYIVEISFSAYLGDTRSIPIARVYAYFEYNNQLYNFTAIGAGAPLSSTSARYNANACLDNIIRAIGISPDPHDIRDMITIASIYLDYGDRLKKIY
jgi:flagellin-like protein